MPYPRGEREIALRRGVSRSCMADLLAAEGRGMQAIQEYPFLKYTEPCLLEDLCWFCSAAHAGFMKSRPTEGLSLMMIGGFSAPGTVNQGIQRIDLRYCLPRVVQCVEVLW
jgi:hypothetical protein